MQRNQRDVPEHEIYMSVVDAVSKQIQNLFIEENGDDRLLDVFVSAWKEKFMQTKVVEPGLCTSLSGAPRRLNQNQTYNRVEIMPTAHKPSQSSLKDLLNIQVKPGTVKLNYTPIVQPPPVAYRPFQPQPVPYCAPNGQGNQLQKLLDMKPLGRSSFTSIPSVQIRVLPQADQSGIPSQGHITQAQSLQLHRVVSQQMQSLHRPRVLSQIQGLSQIRPNNLQITNHNMATMIRQGSVPQLFVHHLPQMTSQGRPLNQVMRIPAAVPGNAVPQRMPVIAHQQPVYNLQVAPNGLQNVRVVNTVIDPNYVHLQNFKLTQLDGVAFMDDDDSDDSFDEIDVAAAEDDISVTISPVVQFTEEDLKKGKFKIEFRDGIIMAKNKEKIFQLAQGVFT